MQSAAEKVKELVNLLNDASNAYYNSGNTIMSDEEFDSLLNSLKKLEVQTGLVLSNSPTQNVGAQVLLGQSKVEHKVPMLSLDKCHNIDELIKFAENDDCYLSLKLDGLSTRLIYSNGRLIKASTRGDGSTGSDITEHVRQYDNVPINIDYQDTLVLDGESLILYSDFNNINESLSMDEQFKNARNLASGTLSTLDMSIVKQRHMKFIAWRVIDGFDEIKDSNVFKLKEAKKLGFDVVDMFTYTNRSNDKENLSHILHKLRDNANTKGIPIDGIVIAKDSISLSNQLGRTSKFFRHSIAYKFDDEEYETRLIDIEFTMGKTGCLTPTASFKPVIIDGTTVERASLANFSIIKKLGLTNNCTVFVKKANCIIPQITRALPDGDSAIKIPDICPICGEKTAIIKENESEVLVCSNKECTGKLLGKLKFFVSKPAANIDGLSEATLAFLINKGWIKNFKDIYYLEQYKNEWQKCDGFGKRSVEKILNAIEKSRSIDLAHFICALSIPNIGSSASKTISQHFRGHFNIFIESVAIEFDFTKLDDFGDTMNNSIYDYMRNNFTMVEELAKEMRFIEPEQNTDMSLSGLKFCITGSFSQPRDSLKKQLESRGAKFISSVSKNLNVLFAGDKAGSKLTKAQQLGVRVADEQELMKMLGE